MTRRKPKLTHQRLPITLEEVSKQSPMYKLIESNQAKVCAICQEPSATKLFRDHDHKTGYIRGLLCSNCNAGLGMFKDNPRLLAAAIVYLQNHEAEVTGILQPLKTPKLSIRKDKLPSDGEYLQLLKQQKIEEREEAAKLRAEYHGVPYIPNYHSKK